MFESEMKRRTTFSKLQSVYFSLGVSSSFSFEQQQFPIAAVRTIFRQCCSLCDTVQRSIGNMDWFRQQYATDFIFHAFNSPVSCQSGALETCSNFNSAAPTRSTTWRSETNICGYFARHRISFKDAQTLMSSPRISSNYTLLRVTKSLCTKVTRCLLSTRNTWWRRMCCDGYKSTTHTKSGTACYASDIISTSRQHQHLWRCGSVSHNKTTN